MDLQLSGKVFLITGGTRVLGLGTARILVEEGARVVLGSRNPDHVAAAISQLGSDVADGVAIDIQDKDVGQRLISIASQRFGRVDGALVNTGGPRLGNVDDLSDEDWSVAVASTLLAPVRFASSVIRHLRSEGKQGGSVAFVLSTSARQPLARLALSNAIRPGLALHIKDLADAYGGEIASVRVNGLLPGAIDTERSRAGGLSPERVPLKRLGTPDEFGRVAAFILSPAASFVNGSLITVDGGTTRAL